MKSEKCKMKNVGGTRDATVVSASVKLIQTVQTFRRTLFSTLHFSLFTFHFALFAFHFSFSLTSAWSVRCRPGRRRARQRHCPICEPIDSIEASCQIDQVLRNDVVAGKNRSLLCV